MLTGGVVAALAVNALILFRLNTLTWSFVFLGIFVGLLIAFIGQGLFRFYAIGGLTALLGLALAWAGMPEDGGNAIFYSLLGLMLIISGALTLARYLRQNPPASEEQP
jgi:hypothetical protein